MQTPTNLQAVSQQRKPALISPHKPSAAQAERPVDSGAPEHDGSDRVQLGEAHGVINSQAGRVQRAMEPAAGQRDPWRCGLLEVDRHPVRLRWIAEDATSEDERHQERRRLEVEQPVDHRAREPHASGVHPTFHGAQRVDDRPAHSSLLTTGAGHVEQFTFAQHTRIAPSRQSRVCRIPTAPQRTRLTSHTAAVKPVRFVGSAAEWLTSLVHMGRRADAADDELAAFVRGSRVLDDLPELITVTQAARCLGLGRSTLYRLLEEEVLPLQIFHVSREVRLSRRQLTAWLGRHSSRPGRTGLGRHRPQSGLSSERPGLVDNCPITAAAR